MSFQKYKRRKLKKANRKLVHLVLNFIKFACLRFVSFRLFYCTFADNMYKSQPSESILSLQWCKVWKIVTIKLSQLESKFSNLLTKPNFGRYGFKLCHEWSKQETLSDTLVIYKPLRTLRGRKLHQKSFRASLIHTVYF